MQPVEPEPAAPAKPPQPDDLIRIEGIGPKISGVLQAALAARGDWGRWRNYRTISREGDALDALQAPKPSERE